jgi:hypothetical protein
MTNLTAQDFRQINDDAVVLYKATALNWDAPACVQAALDYHGLDVDIDTFENLVSDVEFWGGKPKG